jgi:protein arginine kinase
MSSTRGQKLLEADSGKLFDKIGRAYGILQNSAPAEFERGDEPAFAAAPGHRPWGFPRGPVATVIDRLFIEAQPGHIQHATGKT